MSIVFKAKTKKYEENNMFLKGFNSKLKNALFSVLAFKTIDAHVLFWSVFLKSRRTIQYKAFVVKLPYSVFHHLKITKECNK